MSPTGRLEVVATPIGNLGDLSPRAVAALRGADVLACEDTRHTGRLLAAAGIRATRLVSLHAHNEASRTAELVNVLGEGAVVALVSDAGTPLVSDPGGRLVAAAVAAGATVTAIPGPSALLAALMVSALDTTRFRFEGFLPRKGAERRQRIAACARAEEPSVIYESPRRVGATLGELAVACGGERRVVVARELTKLHEEVWRGPLGEAVAASAGEPRGEHVIVLDAAPPRPPTAGVPAELGAALAKLLAAGMTRRDAALAAETLLGIGHRTAYAAALAAEAEEAAAPSSEALPDTPIR